MRTDERLLIPLTYGFSVRYLLPTGLLEQLGDVCVPVVGLGWDDPDLSATLERAGVETVRLPDARLDHSYRMYRRRLAVLHQRRLDSVTARIQRERRAAISADLRSRAIGRTRSVLDQVAVRRPGGASAVERGEAAAVAAGTNVEDFAEVLRTAQIDAVLSVTPYHDQDGLVLWAAGDSKIRSLTSVISFDNPTTRDRMIHRSETIAVWNRFNENELLRSYPDLTPGRLRIVGAPQFDLHRMPDLVTDEADWRRRSGLDSDRPVILYGAGPSSLIPEEQRLVRAIDEMIDDGRIEGRPQLLVRRHPNDPVEPWAALGAELRHARVVDPWAPGSSPFRSWPSDDDLRLQMSTLAHSAVHVNVCSSMTLDGAMFDRPQVGPTFVPGASAAENARVRSYYDQEHWLPISRSGGLATATDEASLAAAIVDGLTDPDRRAAGREAMIRDVLSFDDGRSSQRLVAEVADL